VKKAVVTILAVAIIGALGVYGKSHSSSAQPGSSNTAVQSADTASPQTTSNDNSSSTPAQAQSAGTFKDGTFTGNSEDTPYGTVQIAVVVSGGKITGVNFLQMPNDRGHTQEVTAFSAPLLKQETLQKQSSHIDFVSGATSTSEGYQQSLQSALDQAA
jgi:uncharacterized protein with FMN-binding domain